MVVDDGEGSGPADGAVRIYSMPGGTKSVEFRARDLGASTVTFANEAHDYPKTITYAREDTGRTVQAQ